MFDQVESRESNNGTVNNLSNVWTEHLNKGDSPGASKPVAQAGDLPSLDITGNGSARELLSSLAAPKLALAAPEKAQAAAQPKSYLQSFFDAGTSRIVSNEETRNTINRLGAEFVKTASLFTAGKLGMAGTFLAYGLDQARPSDSWKEQAADFALGAAKGETMRGMFMVVGSSGAAAPLKGALLGLGSGAADEVFKRQTFTDPSSLNDRLRRNAFNPQAVLMNAAVFTAGEGLYEGINLATKGALAENKMVSGMVMGGSFGFVGGSVGEASREMREKGTVNPGKVLLHGVLEGGVTAAAAGVGMKVSDPVFQQKVKDSTLSALESLGLRSPASPAELNIAVGQAERLSIKKKDSDKMPPEPDPDNPRRPDDQGGPYNEPGSGNGPDGPDRRPDDPGGPYNEPGSDGGPFMGIKGRAKAHSIVKSEAHSRSSSRKEGNYPYEPDPENPRRNDSDPGGFLEPGADLSPDGGNNRRYDDSNSGPFLEPGSDGGFCGLVGKTKVNSLIAKSEAHLKSSSKKDSSGYPYEPDPENPRLPGEPGGPYNEPGSGSGPDGGGDRRPGDSGGPFNEPGSDGGPFMGLIARPKVHGLIGKTEVSMRASTKASKGSYPYEPDPENPRQTDSEPGPFLEPGANTGPDSGGSRRYDDSSSGGPFMESGGGGGAFMGLMARPKVHGLIGKTDVSTLASSKASKGSYPYEPDPENPRQTDSHPGPFLEPGADTGPDSGGSRRNDSSSWSGPFMEPGSDGGAFMGLMARMRKK
jgi:hypothetical protein